MGDEAADFTWLMLTRLVDRYGVMEPFRFSGSLQRTRDTLR